LYVFSKELWTNFEEQCGMADKTARALESRDLRERQNSKMMFMTGIRVVFPGVQLHKKKIFPIQVNFT
jgi:hypothetical protein